MRPPCPNERSGYGNQVEKVRAKARARARARAREKARAKAKAKEREKVKARAKPHDAPEVHPLLVAIEMTNPTFASNSQRENVIKEKNALIVTTTS